MKRKFMVLVAIVLLSCFFSTIVQAEDKPQIALGLNAKFEVAPSWHLTTSLNFLNLITAYGPYLYFGTQYQVNKYFNLAAFVGYGFENKTTDRGLLGGVALTGNYDKWTFSTDLEYLGGIDCFWSYNYVGYKPLSWLMLSADNRNYYYVRSEDKNKSMYQAGPSVMFFLGKNTVLKFVYFRSFEQDGEDANIFRVVLKFNF